MSIEKRARSGVLAGAFGFGSQVIYSLLLVPIFLSYWGREQYGVWLSILAAQSVLQTVDAGHLNYLGNELNRVAHGSPREFGRTVGSGLAVASMLGFIQVGAVIVIICAGWVPKFLGLDPISLTHLGQIKTALLVFVVVNIPCGVAGGVLVRAYAPIGHFARGQWWGVVMRLVQSGALALGVWLGADLPVLAAIFGAANLAVSALNLCDIRARLQAVHLWDLRVDLRLGFLNLGRSLVLCFTGLVDQFSGNGLVLLVSHSLTMATVPVFTTLRTLANTAMQASNIMLQPVSTDFVRLHVARRGRDINEALRIGWLVCGAGVNLIMIACLPIAPTVYNLWVRRQINFDEIAFMLFVWTVVLKNFGAPLVMYLTSNNNLSFQTTATITRNVLALIGAILGLRIAGIRGIALALVVAELAASVVVPLIFTQRGLASLGCKIDRPSLWLAIAEQATVASLAVGYFLVPAHHPALALAAASILAVLAGFRWLFLPSATRARLGRMLVPAKLLPVAG